MKVWVLTRSHWDNPCRDFKGVWCSRPAQDQLTKVVLDSYIAQKIEKDGKYTDPPNDKFWYLEEKDTL